MAETPTIVDVKSDYKFFKASVMTILLKELMMHRKAQHDQISDDALARGIISDASFIIYRLVYDLWWCSVCWHFWQYPNYG